MNLGYGYVDKYGALPYKQEPSGSRYPRNRIDHVTGVCLRLAIKPHQGAGWCFYANGSHMVWPYPNVRPIDAILDNDQTIKLAIDELSGLVYEIQTFNGPVGSGITRTYLDKDDGYHGAEIPCSILLPEKTGTEEHMLIDHQEGHVQFRPQDEEMKGTSGHTDKGFRDAFKVNLNAYEDGAANPTAIAKDVPVPSDINYDRKVESHRLQTAVNTSTSSWKLVRIAEYYTQKDKRGSPEERALSEGLWQTEWALPLLHISRGADMLLNLADGVTCGGSYLSEVDGPDGNDDSAMRFAGTTGLTFSIADIAGDMTIAFWVSAITVPADIVEIGNMRVWISQIAGAYWLNYIDGSGVYSQLMNWDGTGWRQVGVVRDGDRIRFYEQGVQIGSSILSSIATITGNGLIMDGEMGDVFDVRIIDSAISANGILYYKNDVLENSGKVLLPLV